MKTHQEIESEDEDFDEDEKQAEPKDSVSALIMGFAPMKKKEEPVVEAVAEEAVEEDGEAPPGSQDFDTEQIIERAKVQTMSDSDTIGTLNTAA